MDEVAVENLVPVEVGVLGSRQRSKLASSE